MCCGVQSMSVWCVCACTNLPQNSAKFNTSVSLVLRTRESGAGDWRVKWLAGEWLRSPLLPARPSPPPPAAPRTAVILPSRRIGETFLFKSGRNLFIISIIRCACASYHLGHYRPLVYPASLTQLLTSYHLGHYRPLVYPASLTQLLTFYHLGRYRPLVYPASLTQLPTSYHLGRYRPLVYPAILTSLISLSIILY